MAIEIAKWYVAGMMVFAILMGTAAWRDGELPPGASVGGLVLTVLVLAFVWIATRLL